MLDTPLSKQQRLLLLSCHPDTVECRHPAPEWLIDECVKLGLVKRIGATGAVRMTILGVQARQALLD